MPVAVRSVGVAPALAPPTEPTAWGSALDSIREINERCLGALTEMALGSGSPALALVAALRGAFSRVDAGSRVRAADLPFLLVDMKFGCADQWSAWTGTPLSVPIQGHAVAGFPVRTAVPLARGTLALAATVCRHAPGLAGVHGGLVPQVTAALARSRMSELEDIAERHHAHLRPRWEGHPSVWRQLLAAATSADHRALERFRLRGLQLLAGAWGAKGMR